MKRLITIPLLLMPTLAIAQQISVSPTSAPIWGKTPGVAAVSISYANFEVVYFHAMDRMHDGYGAAMEGGYTGLFWKPLNFEFKGFRASGGTGYLLRKFPTVNGRNLHFTAQLTYALSSRLGVKWSHYSNGFGLFCDLNPGIDNISLVINL